MWGYCSFRKGKRRTSSNNRMRRGRCGNKMRVLHSLHFEHALDLLFFSFSFFLFFFFPLSQLSPSPHFDPSFSIDNQIEKRDHDVGFTRRQNDSSTQWPFVGELQVWGNDARDAGGANGRKGFSCSSNNHGAQGKEEWTLSLTSHHNGIVRQRPHPGFFKVSLTPVLYRTRVPYRCSALLVSYLTNRCRPFMWPSEAFQPMRPLLAGILLT